MNLKVTIYAGILTAIVLFASHFVFSQAAEEEFGKNRIQYKSFDWRFYNTDNFDIYYYDGGEWLARVSAEYMEDEFNKITDILGYAPYFKTKIFIYNSVADLHQSNVGMQDARFSEGGQTEFVKTHVEVAYPGSVSDFKSDLIFRISKMLIYDMMYGGSLTDMFQNSYLLNLPEWFMDGAALYLAKGWDVSLDDYMRDLMQNKKVKNLNKFTGDEARMVGQSVWNFIAEKYGKSNISNILNLTRIIRNEERSVSNTLGISFRNFMFEWQSFYASMGARISGSYQLPEKENLLNKNHKDLIYSDMAISPDGSYMAYVTINSGKYKATVVNLTKRNRKKNALSGGYKLIEQEFNQYQPVVAWQNNETLGIVGTLYGRTHLWLYDLSNNRRTKKDIGKLNNVRSFDLDDGGSLAVLSADIDGKNDLFLLSLRRNSIKRITNDIFDDTHPRFIPNTSSIVFSSNRPTDSLNVADHYSMSDLKSGFNLYTYSIDTTRNILGRLTNTLNDNLKPIPANETEIYYLSDQKGIFNLYKYSFSNRIYNQVSNYAHSLKDFDLNIEKGLLGFVSINDENEQAYLVKDFNFDNNIFTAQTTRQEVSNAKMAAQRILQRRAIAAKDSVEKAEQTKTLPKREVKSELEQELESSDGLINTDNYTFEESATQEIKPRESFLEAFRKTSNEAKITGPHDYETRFSANSVVTTFLFDPIIGFGIQLKSQLTDLLENHKFFGGITATTDFTSGRLFAEYHYLKTRFDYKLRYDRNVVQMTDNFASQKYILNKLKLTAALPFTVSSRISVSPFVANTSYYDLGTNILNTAGDYADMVYYGGFEANYVFDNTIATNLNSYEGLRAKLSLIHHEGLEDRNKSFTNMSLDIRNYQKIYRELVFATRFFYGRFFGPNKQTYLLGGMDNWILSKTATREGERNPLETQEYIDNSGILFLEYVTSLRGFSYNAFNGNNAMLFNAELRLPLLRVLYKGPIASNFFRNLQFVGFYDIGSAWTGNSPFATENSINTETITSGPFEVRLKNFRNPWLSSYGVGVRTMVLGYYAKFDFAYPVEDYIVQKPRFHVTLGYDF